MQTLLSTKFQFNNLTLNVTLDDAKDPWFNANEVCEILGYANPRDAIATHVPEDCVAKRDALDGRGLARQTNFISEPGMYALVFGSKLEAAQAFRRWVFAEVLPAIRKEGAYTTPEKKRLLVNAAQAKALADPIVERFWVAKTGAHFRSIYALLDDYERELQISCQSLRDDVENRERCLKDAADTPGKRAKWLA